jgi:hypothetical protein
MARQGKRHERRSHMEDRIRRAIERLAGKFSSKEGDFEALRRRKRRREARHRIEAGVVSVAVVGTSGLFLLRTFGPTATGSEGRPVGPAAGGTSVAPATVEPTPSPPVSPPDCPTVGVGGYAPDFSVLSGPVGSTVTVSAPQPLFGPGGDFHPSPWGFTQVWWNVSPDQTDYLLPGGQYVPLTAVPGQLAPWTIQPPENAGDPDVPKVPTGPGGIGLLAEAPDIVGTTLRCDWSITFAVPDVPAGTYPIAVVSVDKKPSGGSLADRGWVEFTVSS